MSSILIRYVAVVAIVAVFAIFLTESGGNYSVSGWDDFSDAIGDDMLSGLDDFPPPPVLNSSAPAGCDPWEFCWWEGGFADTAAGLSYIGALLYWVADSVYTVASWFFTTVISFLRLLFGILTFDIAGMPSDIRTVLLVLTAPMWVIAVITVAKLVRG